MVLLNKNYVERLLNRLGGFSRRQYEGSVVENINGVAVCKLQPLDSFYDAGYHYGMLFKPELEAMIDFLHLMLRRQLRAMGLVASIAGPIYLRMKCRKIYNLLHPNHREELRGIAAATELPRHMLFMLSLGEMMSRTTPECGCSAVLTKRGDKRYLGHNLDFTPNIIGSRLACIVFYNVMGRKFGTVGFMGYPGALHGFNEYGLCVTANVCNANSGNTNPGSIMWTLREVVEQCDNVRSAREWLRRDPNSMHGWMVSVVDKTEGFLVEIYGQRRGWLELEESDIFATNSFATSELACDCWGFQSFSHHVEARNRRWYTLEPLVFEEGRYFSDAEQCNLPSIKNIFKPPRISPEKIAELRAGCEWEGDPVVRDMFLCLGDTTMYNNSSGLLPYYQTINFELTLETVVFDPCSNSVYVAGGGCYAGVHPVLCFDMLSGEHTLATESVKPDVLAAIKRDRIVEFQEEANLWDLLLETSQVIRMGLTGDTPMHLHYIDNRLFPTNVHWSNTSRFVKPQDFETEFGVDFDTIVAFYDSVYKKHYDVSPFVCKSYAKLLTVYKNEFLPVAATSKRIIEICEFGLDSTPLIYHRILLCSMAANAALFPLRDAETALGYCREAKRFFRKLSNLQYDSLLNDEAQRLGSLRNIALTLAEKN
ncbi:hypothetical protein PCE1_003899 [Barthelona sp. PCE]